MSERLEAWRERGRLLDVFGHRVFVVHGEGPTDRLPLLVLHGFPTCSFDFERALPLLTAQRPVVLFDFLGFGLSDKPPEYSYSLLEQAESAVEVWRQLGYERGHLLGHDYGTSVVTEILARRERRMLPVAIESVTLCNGSVHIELAQLTVSQRILRDPRVGPVFARLASRKFFKSRLRSIFAKPDALPDEDLDAMWEALTSSAGKDRISQISQYLRERRTFWHRWIGALTQLDIPTHVLWGREDPIAVPEIAMQLERETPGAKLTWLDDLGHYPQAEDAQRWSAAVLGWLEDKE